MPFAGYKNFKECVSENQDKGDPEAYCAVIMRKVEGKEEKADERVLSDPEADKNETIAKIEGNGKLTMERLRKAYAKAYIKQQAKHTGLDQVPPDYKKLKLRKLARYWSKAKKTKSKCGPQINASKKTAIHSIGMNKYAEIDMAFLRQGSFRALNGKNYFYPWEIISRDKKTWLGKEFYMNHDELGGKEMGLITSVYEKAIGGVDWACAKVKVPELPFTQSFLDRIENGLIRMVSSTHTSYSNPEDPTRTVQDMVGEGISTVTRGEVEGARILGIKRNITAKAG